MFRRFRQWHNKWAFFMHSLGELVAACIYSPLVVEEKPNIDILSNNVAIFSLIMGSALFGVFSRSECLQHNNQATKRHALTILGSILQITLAVLIRLNETKAKNFVSCAYGIAFFLNQSNAEAHKLEHKNRNNANDPSSNRNAQQAQLSFYGRHIFMLHCLLSFSTALLYIIELGTAEPEKSNKLAWLNVALLSLLIVSAASRLIYMIAAKPHALQEFRISHINTTGFATSLLIPTVLALHKGPAAFYQAISYFVGQSTALMAHNFTNGLQHSLTVQRNTRITQANTNRPATVPTTLQFIAQTARSPIETNIEIPSFAVAHTAN